MKLAADQQYVVGWAGLGLLGIGILYVAIKYALPALAKQAANAAKAASQSTDSNGNPVDYSGAGPIVGPIASASNYLTGGTAATLGTGIGGGLFSIFGASSPNQGNTYYTTTFPDGSMHTVNSDSVDANARFNYNGQTYILGDDGSGHKIATALSTVYGSGSGGSTNDGSVDDSLWAGYAAGG